MKVTISYGCDLEDIPKTMGDLINLVVDGSVPSLLRELKQSRDCLYHGNNNDALLAIDSARQKLAKMDQQLMDYGSIVAGYVKTDADLKMGIDPTTPQETMPENAFDAKEIIDDQTGASSQSESKE